MTLNLSQLKALSEFLNTVAAAWFSAGVISPLFIKPESLLNILILIVIAIIMAGVLWNAENTFYFAAIISSVFWLILYLLFLRRIK